MPSLASLAVAFATGVAAALHLGAQRPVLAVLVWISAALFVLARFGGRGRALLCVALLCGGLRATVAEVERRYEQLPASVRADDRGVDVVQGVIAGPIVYTRTRSGVRARVPIELDSPARARVEVLADAPLAALPGDRVQTRGRLARPRGYRNPGGVDRVRAARARGVDFELVAHDLEIVESDAAFTPWRAAAKARAWAVATIESRAGEPVGRALVRALVTGDHSGLDPADKDRYRDAGVAHILAVSGLHLAVISGFVFVAARRLWASVPALAARIRPALAAAVCAALPALGYALITGGRISTLRALLVVGVMLWGAASARRARVLDALGFAAVALLIHRPYCLFDLGFQLSFAAAATLVLVAGHRRRALGSTSVANSAPDGPLARRGRVARAAARPFGWAYRALRASLWTSVWATLATAPFIAFAFAQIPLAGLIGNLFVVPVVALCVLPAGLCGVVLYQLWPSVGGLVLDLAIAAATQLDRAVAALAHWLPPTSVWPPGRMELLACIGALAAAVACVRHGGWRAPKAVRLAAVCGLLAAVGVHLWSSYERTWWRTHVTVTFLDVGQGDAAVVELPGGAVWMIDGGGLPFVSRRAGRPLPEPERQRRASAPGRHAVLRFLAARRIRHIDRLIISHPHPDHYEGLFALHGAVSIGEVWVARGHGRAPDSYDRLLTALRAAGTTIHHPRLDRPYAHGSVALRVVGPRYLDDVATQDPVLGANDNSLVAVLSAFGRSVLFAGDLEVEGEELLVERLGASPPDTSDVIDVIDVIKVPHHGSDTSSTPALVAATRPSWAIVSCGRANRFGFPSGAVLARWRDVGARIARTDATGAVTVHLYPDGELTLATYD